ncbi:hypothetical protein V5P93_003902 [Actinokineospora auranticolor]|uniref:Deoxyribonuclease NucA/NucB n=1 Tax=Actinokineospora auranticolor TaxID=155976 RepID=A0A2S6GLZ5_9PSEU|nr:hypothetical protein [Actinokineospora auranticolor]PPK66186.1 deoxyribonuclease NucA/NucB [Actinokineospora auranticolor]
MPKKRWSVAAGAVALAGAIFSAVPAVATPAGTPITLQEAAVSKEKFVELARQSEKNTCQFVTKGQDRCISIQFRTSLTDAANHRDERARTGRDPLDQKLQSASLREPDCEYDFIRITSCRYKSFSYIVKEVINGFPGREIGGQDLDFDTEVAWNYDSLSWFLRSRVTTTESWGTEKVPVPAVVGTGCDRDAQVCTSTSGGSYSINLLSDVTHTQDWEQQETGVVSQGLSSYVYLTGYIGASIIISPVGSPGKTLSLNIGDHNGVRGRCDRVVRTYPGCTAAEEPAIIRYNAISHPLVTEVANHVYDAERSLPGKPGSLTQGTALTLGDDTTEAANRAVACPSGNTPPGKSCDEYPIARSNEGAASGKPYSTRYVAPTANSSQGGLTANHISLCRILKNESFYVYARRADGSSSWDI